MHLHPLASWLGAALSVQMQAWQGKHCNALQAQGEVPQGFSSAQALGQSLIRQNVSKSALRQKALAWLACGCTGKCTTHHHTILESYKYSICFFIVCTLEMIAHVFSIICKNLLLSLSLKTSAYSILLHDPQSPSNLGALPMQPSLPSARHAVLVCPRSLSSSPRMSRASHQAIPSLRS